MVEYDFQTSATLTNSTIIGSNPSSDALGAGFIAYSSDFIEIENNELIGTDLESEILVNLYEVGDAIVSNNTFSELYMGLLDSKSSSTTIETTISLANLKYMALRVFLMDYRRAILFHKYTIFQTTPFPQILATIVMTSLAISEAQLLWRMMSFQTLVVCIIYI